MTRLVLHSARSREENAREEPRSVGFGVIYSRVLYRGVLVIG